MGCLPRTRVKAAGSHDNREELGQREERGELSARTKWPTQEAFVRWEHLENHDSPASLSLARQDPKSEGFSFGAWSTINIWQAWYCWAFILYYFVTGAQRWHYLWSNFLTSRGSLDKNLKLKQQHKKRKSKHVLSGTGFWESLALSNPLPPNAPNQVFTGGVPMKIW